MTPRLWSTIAAALAAAAAMTSAALATAGSVAAGGATAVGAHAQVPRARTAQPLARLALNDVIEAEVSLSADGRYVAFASRAALVPADVNGAADVYVLDRGTGRLTLESVALDGGAGNGSSGQPRLSGDARWLVFESGATNLAAETQGLRGDVYLRDRLAGQTRALTRQRPGDDATTAASDGAISADGRVVAFASKDTHLIDGPDANGHRSDVYVLTIATGTMVRASVTSGGVQPAEGASFAPSLSADGTIVAFTATANLVTGGAAFERPQVFVRDLARGTTRLVSASADGQPGNQISHSAAISGDGRLVAFVSMATNLDPQDDNRLSDVYVRDLETGAMTLVSRSTRGKAGNGHSSHVAMATDGRVVAFVSEASDLTCGRRCTPEDTDDNLLPDVFVADLRTGRVRRVSGAADHAWWTPSQSPTIDAHGTIVVFPSKEPIEPRDVSDDYDLYLWEDRDAPAPCR